MASSPTEESSIEFAEEGDPRTLGDQRREGDRRERPTRPWIGLLGPLRRIRGRREKDRAEYVDRYSRRDVALILAVFMMNVGDAFFTMLWLDRGGLEANPAMDFLLDISPFAFLLQKCVVVGIWLIVLVVHKNFRFARIGLYLSLAVYVVLMVVHFGILASGIEPPMRTGVEKAKDIGHDRMHGRLFQPRINRPSTKIVPGRSVEDPTDQIGNGRLDA